VTITATQVPSGFSIRHVCQRGANQGGAGGHLTSVIFSAPHREFIITSLIHGD